MKRKMKRMELSLIIVCAIILLWASYSKVTYASPEVEEQKESSLSLNQVPAVSVDDSDVALPDYLLRLSEYLSKGNASELERIRHQMVEQEKINRERIESTKGAVLNFRPPDSPLLDWPPTYSCLSDVVYASPDMYDYPNPPHNLIGYIRDAERIEGSEDGAYAHLHTSGWDHNYENPHGGEALTKGFMIHPARGDIYVQCRVGPHQGSRPPWDDYVLMWTSNSIDGPWDYRGFQQVPFGEPTLIYFGTTYSQFSCISISCWTPPPHPIWCPDLFNCVEIDYTFAADITPDWVTTPSVNGPASGYVGTSYEFSASSIDSYNHNIQYTFDWGDGSPQTVTGWISDGATAYASHSWSSTGPFSVTVKAQCSYGVWSGWSDPFVINIQNPPIYHLVTVLGYDETYGYPLNGAWVLIDSCWVGYTGGSFWVSEGIHTIQAYRVDYGWYYWDVGYYTYDGIVNWNNPMTVTITEDKTITAHYYFVG